MCLAITVQRRYGDQPAKRQRDVSRNGVVVDPIRREHAVFCAQASRQTHSPSAGNAGAPAFVDQMRQKIADVERWIADRDQIKIDQSTDVTVRDHLIVIEIPVNHATRGAQSPRWPATAPRPSSTAARTRLDCLRFLVSVPIAQLVEQRTFNP